MQHVFQFVVCLCCVTCRVRLCTSRSTHTRHCANYNDVILLIVSTKSNFDQAQYRLPADGLHGPKHVGVTVKKSFNVNFNILLLLLLLLLLVFSPWAGLGRDQSSVTRLVWLWYPASWASS